MSNAMMLPSYYYVSDLPKLGLKGPGAESWLRDRGIDVPPSTYDTLRLPDGDLIVRLGTADFFLEGAESSDLLPRIAAETADHPPRVYRVERHDASFLLSGPQALQVLAHLCSFDFRSSPTDRVILTRTGGVNCMVLPEADGEAMQFKLWVDSTYATFIQEAMTLVNRDADPSERSA